MKRIRPYLIAIVISLAAFGVPLLSMAQQPCPADTLNSPFCNLSLTQILEKVLRAFVMLMLPVLVVFIILAGLSFVTARGNPEKLTLAKWNFLFVIIGTILILGAWTWANLIGGIVTDVTR